ncbi:MAG: hypothetical protein NZ750_11110 [Anaerolineae bacterium]|nr:hypothetical protein [Anaerolineae bacterium]MDW8171612.1 hypothetical protein [Anaerolineae bacterium]
MSQPTPCRDDEPPRSGLPRARARCVYPSAMVCGQPAWPDDDFDVLLSSSLVS